MSLFLLKTRQWISLLRLIPFNTDTSEGRSRERFRRAALTALVSVFSQAISMLTVLISVPLTLRYLGAERYGLWLTISSLIAILGFADLGMGNGLLNAIADANGRDDRRAIEAYVSSAFYMLTGTALFLGVIWFFIYTYIPWARLFNVSTIQAMVEAGPSTSVFICCMLAGLPIGLVQKIYNGYQEGYLNGFWRAGGSVLGLVSVLFAIYLQADLPWLVLSMAGSPVLVLLVNGVILFGVQRPWLRPRWQMVDRAACIQIFKNGSLFFILQLAVAIGFQSDNLVVAHFLGADKVPQYAVPMKLFMQIPSLLSFALAPLWPAYGEAIARRDVIWVLKTFKRSLLFSFGASLLPALILFFWGSGIIELWVGTEIKPDLVLLAGLGLWVMLLSLAGPLSMLLNGVNVIGFQIICAVLMTAGNITFSIFLVQKIGVSGPVYGSSISWLLFSLFPSILFIPQLFKSWKEMKLSKQDVSI